MPPVYVKGGIWTNVEDQILKAAVSKYGLNQWARVASLLTKKSAKQAKARWNEWLNPNINKSDWSRQDDERLLSLAKILPNQWRSIAPMLGRTPTHCVERYQKLLEDAASNSPALSLDNDLSMIGPGIESLPATGSGGAAQDLNINPESKPSRPDLEDLDDEEREMLSEAKARLANTSGKKAKRKQRDRMLEESKRIALLQKRRELKAAGIKVSLVSKNKQKSKEFDYNADIPHERTPQIGIYDTNQEESYNQQSRSQFESSVSKKGISLKEVDDKHKKEKLKQKQDKLDWKKRQRQELEAAAELFSQNEDRLLKKRKLDLPAPNHVPAADIDVASADIDQRIQDKTRELIAQQQTKSTLLPTPTDLPQQEQSSSQPPQNYRLDAKAQRRLKQSLQKFIQTSLKSLPPPRGNPTVVIPSFDPSEDAILTNDDYVDEENGSQTVDSKFIDQGERLRTLEIARQVDEVKRQLRRSQVVQRGLKIPHPSSLVTSPTSSSPLSVSSLEQHINRELVALVRSDYAKYEADVEDKHVTLLSDLDELTHEQVHAEIQKDLASSSPESLHPGIQSSLSFASSGYKLSTKETSISEIQSQVKSAQIINQSLQTQLSSEVEASFIQSNNASYDQSLKQAINDLQAHNDQIQKLNIELNTYETISTLENSAMQASTSRLHALVDELVQAEQHAQLRVRSLKLAPETK